MIISLISVGLISILGQVVLLRELNVAFYGVELIYLFALGIWLFWTASGALIGRRIYFPSPKHIAFLFLVFAVTLPLDVVFIRASRILVGGVPGAYLSLLQQLMITVISLLPAGLLSGLLFQWSAKIYVASGRMLAMAYAIESAGGLIGGLLATLFLRWGIQNCTIALVCGLALVITPLVFLRGPGQSTLQWTAAILAGIFLMLLWNAPFLDRQMTLWNHPNLVESRDTPYGKVSVSRLHGQISVFENDALAFETEGIEAEYFVHLAALQHPSPRHVLILGGGIEGTVREMLQHGPEKIDYVELNQAMLKLVSGHLPDAIQKSLKDPRVQIIFADPRLFLKESGTYDLILVGMPEPQSGQTNRFYTKEFFAQCAAKLNSGGIQAFRLRSAEDLWSPQLLWRTASIYRALTSVFTDVLFLPGTTNVVTASRKPLSRLPEAMSGRLQERKIKTKLISANYIKYLLTNDRFFEIEKLLQRETAQPNTDLRPICYQYAFMIWLSKFFPSISLLHFSFFIDQWTVRPSFQWLLYLCLPVAFFLSRLWPAWRRVLLVAVAGFVGMVLETILILYYQAKHGVLYQDIGILLMSFMTGLALGSMTVNKWMVHLMNRQKPARWYGVGLLVGFVLLCLIITTIITLSASSGLAQASLLLAAVGILVAGIFAYVSLYEIQDQKSVISSLYSADLIGGCAGSLLAGLILIPVAGIDITTRAMVVLAVFSILLV
jgi:spermidine synthase